MEQSFEADARASCLARHAKIVFQGASPWRVGANAKNVNQATCLAHICLVFDCQIG